MYGQKFHPIQKSKIINCEINRENLKNSSSLKPKYESKYNIFYNWIEYYFLTVKIVDFKPKN